MNNFGDVGIVRQTAGLRGQAANLSQTKRGLSPSFDLRAHKIDTDQISENELSNSAVKYGLTSRKPEKRLGNCNVKTEQFDLKNSIFENARPRQTSAFEFRRPNTVNKPKIVFKGSL